MSDIGNRLAALADRLAQAARSDQVHGDLGPIFNIVASLRKIAGEVTVADAVLEDARASSQRYLEEKREAETRNAYYAELLALAGQEKPIANLADIGAKVPIPMRLHCPSCGALHIDEGEFATKSHHTHACQHCGEVWRPAIVPTIGVQFLPGFKNEVKS